MELQVVNTCTTSFYVYFIYCSQTFCIASLPVWQKLEEENQEFFNAYYLRLMVKSQIIEFNRLLEQQAQMMHQIHPCAVTALSSSNGSHVQPSKAAFLLVGSLIFICYLLNCYIWMLLHASYNVCDLLFYFILYLLF